MAKKSLNKKCDLVINYMKKNELVNISQFCVENFYGIKGIEIDNIIYVLKNKNLIYEYKFKPNYYNLTEIGKLFIGFGKTSRYELLNKIYKESGPLINVIATVIATILAIIIFFKSRH